MRVVCLVVLLMASAGTVAAETTEEAMRAFGLLGTWSPDCADSGKLRLTFKKDEVVATAADQPTTTTRYEAVRITEDRIRMTYHSDGKQQSELIERVGKRIKLAGVDLLEHCLN